MKQKIVRELRTSARLAQRAQARFSVWGDVADTNYRLRRALKEAAESEGLNDTNKAFFIQTCREIEDARTGMVTSWARLTKQLDQLAELLGVE